MVTSQRGDPMADKNDHDEPNTLEDGDEIEVQGSSSTYTLSRQGSVYMCTCPAWKNQSATVDRRTCKHLRAHLGDVAETARLGTLLASRVATTSGGGGSKSSTGKKDTAPPILLAHKWETDHDPTGWWMSEKLDGIRAYWDGETFTSRLGNQFFAPNWFVEDLPADTLDGELWVGRKMFQKTTSIVRSGAAGQEWRTVSFVIFDAPNAKGSFEDRIAHAKKVITKAQTPHARVLDHLECTGVAHLKDELARVESLGGEGLMLRQPKSKYAIGRSTTLLKVKTFHDAEARVIGHADGTGKHKGRLGALVCQLPDGTKFNVGTGFSDAERENPPKIGGVITFRYQELSDDGVPRFPSYVGERLDVKNPAPIGSGAKPVTKVSTAPTAKPVAKPAPAPALPKPTLAPAKKPTKTDDDDDDDDADDDLDEAPTRPATTKDFKLRLEHEDEGKFWEVEVKGTKHYIKFGKIGSPGQTRLTDIGSATGAVADANKRAMQKRKEGYENVPLTPGSDDD
jgi:DNA ligase-1